VRAAQRRLEDAWKDLYLSFDRIFKKAADVHTAVALSRKADSELRVQAV
jgi:hypothetical protein